MPKDIIFIHELQPSGIRYQITLLPSRRVYRGDMFRDDANYYAGVLNAVGHAVPKATPTGTWNFVMNDTAAD